MKKLLKWLFETRRKQLNIPVVGHMFLREGKEIGNQKIVTTPKPNIMSSPQKPRKNC